MIVHAILNTAYVLEYLGVFVRHNIWRTIPAGSKYNVMSYYAAHLYSAMFWSPQTVI